MINSDQMAITSEAHNIPQLCQQIQENNRFRVFVRSESDVLVESYGSAKTVNVPQQYQNRLLKDGTLVQMFFQVHSDIFCSIKLFSGFLNFIDTNSKPMHTEAWLGIATA